jgi:hypothetical protein
LCCYSYSMNAKLHDEHPPKTNTTTSWQKFKFILKSTHWTQLLCQVLFKHLITITMSRNITWNKQINKKQNKESTIAPPPFSINYHTFVIFHFRHSTTLLHPIRFSSTLILYHKYVECKWLQCR